MIIWLASYPRSGNNYFRVLLRHFYAAPLSSLYQVREYALSEFRSKKTEELLDLEKMKRSERQFIIKSHEAAPDDIFPTIYLVRDGRDALVSYAWYLIQVDKLKDDYHALLHRLITSRDFWGGWGAHVAAWTKRTAPSAIVRFEDLVQTSNPLPILQIILDKVGFQLPPKKNLKPLEQFSELHEKDPRIFRKGKIGNWRKEMPQDLADLFWAHHGDIMVKMGYSR